MKKMRDNHSLTYLHNITRSFIFILVLAQFENDLCLIVTPLEINVNNYYQGYLLLV
jgi:hypothetical protein